MKSINTWDTSTEAWFFLALALWNYHASWWLIGASLAILVVDFAFKKIDKYLDKELEKLRKND